MTLRLNVASGFRAPNLAELTSNGIHEGTNRYEVGNSDLKTEQNVQTDLNIATIVTEFFANGFTTTSTIIFIQPPQELK
jgi:iron complex outermembrane receptor protein